MTTALATLTFDEIARDRRSPAARFRRVAPLLPPGSIPTNCARSCSSIMNIAPCCCWNASSLGHFPGTQSSRTNSAGQLISAHK